MVEAGLSVTVCTRSLGQFRTLGEGSNPNRHRHFVIVLAGATEYLYYSEILLRSGRSEHLWTCPMYNDDRRVKFNIKKNTLGYIFSISPFIVAVILTVTF